LYTAVRLVVFREVSVMDNLGVNFLHWCHGRLNGCHAALVVLQGKEADNCFRIQNRNHGWFRSVAF
jgi:hypothetical protein